jgi:hypothetical protein
MRMEPCVGGESSANRCGQCGSGVKIGAPHFHVVNVGSFYIVGGN